VIATWLVVLGTLVLAAVAVFQDTIRGWFYRPRFRITVKTEPPHCVALPMTRPDGTFVADSYYLRLWVENTGNATARNAEVYANRLRRKRTDGTWELVKTFPPMNLKWADVGGIYFPSIAPKMGKHCDIGHITDPPKRQKVGEDVPRLALTEHTTSLASILSSPPITAGISSAPVSTSSTSSRRQRTPVRSDGPSRSPYLELGTRMRTRCSETASVCALTPTEPAVALSPFGRSL